MAKKDYAPKVHLMRNENTTECGLDINEKKVPTTEDPENVTCLNCLRAVQQAKANEKKYPYFTLHKTHAILYDKDGNAEKVDLSLTDHDVTSFFDLVKSRGIKK